MFNENENIKPCNDIKIEFHPKDTCKIYWLKIVNALPKTLKNYFERQKECENIVTFAHHIVRKSQICSLNLVQDGIFGAAHGCRGRWGKKVTSP